MTFVKMSKDTGGEFVELIIAQPPNQEGPPIHKHTLQSEYFEVLEGNLGIQCGKEKKVLQTGESYTVPANKWHTYYAVDKKSIKINIRLIPALDIEYFLVETYHSSNLHKSENPSKWDNITLISEMKGHYFSKGVPVFIQQYVYPLISRVGILLGYVKVRTKKQFTL